MGAKRFHMNDRACVSTRLCKNKTDITDNLI